MKSQSILTYLDEGQTLSCSKIPLMNRAFNIATNTMSNFETHIAQVWTAAVLQKAALPVSSQRSRRRAGQEITPRGLSRCQAAALTGLSPSGYDKARREGKYPGPTLPGGRYDRDLIEKAMNALSDLVDSEKPDSALDAWRKRSGSR